MGRKLAKGSNTGRHIPVCPACGGEHIIEESSIIQREDGCLVALCPEAFEAIFMERGAEGWTVRNQISPPHYQKHPSGIECIQITEHMNFCCGNAVKYIWRAGLKGDAIRDLEKAGWYISREIKRIKASS